MISPTDRALVEDWGHLRVPAAATDVQFHHERGADPAIWLRLELPASARDELLRGAGYTAPLSTTRRYVTTSMRTDVAWWRPDELATFESGAVLKDEGRPRYGSNLLLGQDGDRLIAYLFVTGL